MKTQGLVESMWITKSARDESRSRSLACASGLYCDVVLESRCTDLGWRRYSAWSPRAPATTIRIGIHQGLNDPPLLNRRFCRGRLLGRQMGLQSRSRSALAMQAQMINRIGLSLTLVTLAFATKPASAQYVNPHTTTHVHHVPHDTHRRDSSDDSSTLRLILSGIFPNSHLHGLSRQCSRGFLS